MCQSGNIKLSELLSKPQTKQVLIAWTKSILINYIEKDLNLRAMLEEKIATIPWSVFAEALQSTLIIIKESKTERYVPRNGLRFRFPIVIIVSSVKTAFSIHLLIHSKLYKFPEVDEGDNKGLIKLGRKLGKIEIQREIANKQRKTKEELSDFVASNKSEFLEKLRTIALKLVEKSDGMSKANSIGSISTARTQKELTNIIQSLLREVRQKEDTRLMARKDCLAFIEARFITDVKECLQCSQRKMLIRTLKEAKAPTFELCRSCFLAIIPPLFTSQDDAQQSHPKAFRWISALKLQGYSDKWNMCIKKGLTDDIYMESIILLNKNEEDAHKELVVHSRSQKCDKCHKPTATVERFNTCAIARHRPMCIKCWKNSLLESDFLCSQCCCVVDKVVLDKLIN
eukprot:TRINITY_DN14108_c0_g2_i1.p1 TRINITY_DN14108_c0_g2~~TRINITY_DN14108_c0_g2_i1.p1  ORF type:complete len:399 (+),score=81.82 TRINITY_DN14108_c0_g2_i1:147-1343(+)